MPATDVLPAIMHDVVVTNDVSHYTGNGLSLSRNMRVVINFRGDKYEVTNTALRDIFIIELNMSDRVALYEYADDEVGYRMSSRYLTLPIDSYRKPPPPRDVLEARLKSLQPEHRRTQRRLC